MDFLAEFCRPFFAGICCSYCRKTDTENAGKNSVEKFGEDIPFLGALFGEQLLTSKSEKFAQNPFCKRDPWIISEDFGLLPRYLVRKGLLLH